MRLGRLATTLVFLGLLAIPHTNATAADKPLITSVTVDSSGYFHVSWTLPPGLCSTTFAMGDSPPSTPGGTIGSFDTMYPKCSDRSIVSDYAPGPGANGRTIYVQIFADTNGSPPYSYSDPATYVLRIATTSPTPTPAPTLGTETPKASITPLPRAVASDIPPGNGTAACDQIRDLLIMGNKLASQLNKWVDGTNTGFYQIKNWTPEKQALYQKIVQQHQANLAILSAQNAVASSRATQLCSPRAAVTLAASDATFHPLPLPKENGSPACHADLVHARYLNSELAKAFGQLKYRGLRSSTNFDKQIPTQQLQRRINVLTNDMSTTWPKTWNQDCL